MTSSNLEPNLIYSSAVNVIHVKINWFVRSSGIVVIITVIALKNYKRYGITSTVTKTDSFVNPL